MFKSHRIQRQSSLKEFPDPSPLKKTGQEERRERRRERAGGWPQLALSLQRPTVFYMQVPMISPDSQTQSWAGAGVGRTAKMKFSHQFEM